MAQTTSVSAEINPIYFHPDLPNGFLTTGSFFANSKPAGFDVADFGASDPRDIYTIAGAARSRPSENVILRAGFEYNLNDNSSGVFHWRMKVDAVIRS